MDETGQLRFHTLAEGCEIDGEFGGILPASGRQPRSRSGPSTELEIVSETTRQYVTARSVRLTATGTCGMSPSPGSGASSSNQQDVPVRSLGRLFTNAPDDEVVAIER